MNDPRVTAMQAGGLVLMALFVAAAWNINALVDASNIVTELLK